jgi:amino acid adenylation domain-containing protein
MTAPAIDDIYPLSPLQQGLLFQSLYAPEAGQHVLQIVCDLRGPLDVAAFQATWAELVRRHGALRASFAWEEVDEPLQIIHREQALPLAALDWRALDEATRQRDLDAFLEADRTRGFSLDTGPLMRLTLLHLEESRRVFVWTCHHLLTDGWSLGLLLRECLATYQALSTGRTPVRFPSRPYRDYIAWVKQQPRSAAERFWRDQLQGFTAPTPVPFARASRGQEAARHGRRVTSLSRALSDRLRDLAREQALTLNTVFQGAWALLLSRYTGQDDVVFGATVSGRPVDLPGAESMVGMFINTLPVRVRVEPDAVLLPWLKRLQATQSESQQYEASSLMEIQGWSELPRGQQLFDTLLVFENFPRTLSEDSGPGALEIGDIDVLDYTHFALDLDVLPGPELTLLATFDAHRLEDPRVARLLSHFVHLLSRMAEQPDAPLRALEILPDAERHRLLAEWSQRTVARPDACSIPVLISEQVERSSQRIAITHGDASWTYAELESRSNRASHRLVAEGVGPDAVVAILAERDLHFPVTVLGVLKAGGAYLPLDPAMPPERLAQVLASSGASRVIVSEGLRELLTRTLSLLEEQRRPRVVSSGDLWAHPESSGPPPLQSTGSNLLYVIYTSGSTGRPKGAMLEQSGKLNHLLAMRDLLKLGPSDVMAQTTSQCFDVSVWQFLTPPLVGARMEIFDTQLQYDAPRFLAELERRGVTVLELVPSLLANLLEELERMGERRYPLASLRWLMPTGEALPPAYCRRWLRMYPDKPLLNAYGPTEVSDDTHLFAIRQPPPEHAERVPIGFTLDNLSSYLLNADLRPVPLGIPGELFIGGVGVGRGYLNDPARTAEVFLPDPFSALPGARFYKTGDVCRFLEDGNLEFMERADFQVKLRGFRIEPGDIESALLRYPHVKQAVAVVRELGQGRELVGYVSLDGAASASPAALGQTLRAFLREQLPHYMVPAVVVVLPSLPLNANGKIDRKALPSPSGAQAEPRAVRAPSSDLEKGLVAIWEELLARRPIGVDESFFDLGGHSLLAIRAHSRMREALGVDLPLRSLFEQVTVEQLAQKVEALRWAANASPSSTEGAEDREEFEF